MKLVGRAKDVAKEGMISEKFLHEGKFYQQAIFKNYDIRIKLNRIGK